MSETTLTEIKKAFMKLGKGWYLALAFILLAITVATILLAFSSAIYYKDTPGLREISYQWVFRQMMMLVVLVAAWRCIRLEPRGDGLWRFMRHFALATAMSAMDTGLMITAHIAQIFVEPSIIFFVIYACFALASLVWWRRMIDKKHTKIRFIL